MIFIYRAFRDLRSPEIVAVVAYLMIAPIFLFLTLFVKDTSVPLLTMLCLAVILSHARFVIRIAVVLSLYAIYGAAFREYYLLIAGIFLIILSWERASTVLRALMVLSIFAALLFLPSHYFTQLEGSRDIFNRTRVWLHIPGGRTAFLNYKPPTDFWSFCVDYIYAFWRLNLAPLFTFGLKELFLISNITIYAFLCWKGLRSRIERVRSATTLFVAHFLVLMLFEPDLGSYLRHASSVLLYTTPALLALDAGFRGVRTRSVQPRLRRLVALRSLLVAD
jgi:hypothetical protein